MKAIYNSWVYANVLILVLCGMTLAQAPTTINYQGRLTDLSGNAVPDDVYSVTFRIYDAAVGGTLLWSEPGVLVTTEKGLFTATLGKPTPFPGQPVAPNQGPAYIFAASKELWLEIETGGSPLAPRSKLESVPYAITANGVSGTSTIDPDIRTSINSEFSTIQTFGWNGEEKVRIWGPGFGEIWLSDWGPAYGSTSEITAQLSAGTNTGGYLMLGDNSGAGTLLLDAGGIGDNSTILPADAINSTEILNEPGIASNQYTGRIDLTSPPAVDIVTVSITIPAAGYIVVDAKCYGLTGTVAGNIRDWVQIDETAGGSYAVPYWQIFGADDHTSGLRYTPMSLYRIYYKSTPGTYTFRLEGAQYSAPAPPPGSTNAVLFPMIKATYFATSYGSVVTTSAVPPPDNSDYTTEVVNDPLSGIAATVYTSDLRYYEMQVQKAEAAALRARLDLEIAKSRAQETADQMIDRK